MFDAATLKRLNSVCVPDTSNIDLTDLTTGLFDHLPDAVLILDPENGRVLAANPRACELFRYPRDEFVGRIWLEAGDGRERRPEYLRRATAPGSCRLEPAAHRCGDGSVVRVEVSASIVERGGRRAVLAAYRNGTDRAATEDRLRQSAKMEAIGHLAGGVAHDFNNLLTIINGYAHALSERMSPSDSLGGAVAEIRAAGDRATDLTRQLLAFSRKQVLRLQSVRLDQLIENLRKMLARLIGEHVRLVTVADPDLALVRADPGQLEQVLINLAVNARDAMPRGGTLTITCRNPAADTLDRFLHLTVSDTGTGMTEEVKARVFEPFFTTKGPGKGTGLGLATVFGIIQQSGGRIAVESRPGVGTSFHIELPVADPSSSMAPIAPAPARGSLSRGSEVVLLVEDESSLRMMLMHALQASGYAVLDAEDGAQALRVVQSFGVPIRLLVTDVVMPEMNGRELADRLQTEQPWLNVLFMSGYTDDEVVRHGVEADELNFLQKPFLPQTLCQRVREVLDGGGSKITPRLF